MILFLFHDAATQEKMKVQSVSFSGNEAFPKRKLLAVMITQPSSFLKKLYFHPVIYNEDLKAVISFYQQNGYLEARIAHDEVVTDSIAKSVRIKIQIDEGALTRIEDISLFDHEVMSEDLLRSKLGLRIGDPFRKPDIEAATVAILILYADHGYLDAEAIPSSRVNGLTHRALIDFAIHENSQFRIGEIDIVGLKKTNPDIVRRELEFKTGEVIKFSLLMRSQQKLYLLGLFQNVYIRPLKSSIDSTRKDIKIELTEKMSGEFNVTFGYESVEKLRARAELYDTNVLGSARKLGLSGKVSMINYGSELSFTDPYTLGSRWRTDIKVNLEHQEEPSYTLNRTGGVLTIGRSFLIRSSALLTYRREIVDLGNIRALGVPVDMGANVRSLKLSFIYDGRDNLFNATRGIYAEWSNELAGFFLTGSNDFTRFSGKVKYFYPLTFSTVLATALEVRMIRANRVSLNERLFAGGPSSIRGFDYQKIGPLDDNRVPLGGKLSFVWNLLEIRQSLYKMIGGAAFMDMGNVWSETEHFNFTDMRMGVGFGFRVNTPIGLARLDFGVNAFPRIDEQRYKIHFSMGQAF